MNNFEMQINRIMSQMTDLQQQLHNLQNIYQSEKNQATPFICPGSQYLGYPLAVARPQFPQPVNSPYWQQPMQSPYGLSPQPIYPPPGFGPGPYEQERQPDQQPAEPKLDPHSLGVLFSPIYVRSEKVRSVINKEKNQVEVDFRRFFDRHSTAEVRFQIEKHPKCLDPNTLSPGYSKMALIADSNHDPEVVSEPFFLQLFSFENLDEPVIIKLEQEGFSAEECLNVLRSSPFSCSLIREIDDGGYERTDLMYFRFALLMSK